MLTIRPIVPIALVAAFLVSAAPTQAQTASGFRQATIAMPKTSIATPLLAKASILPFSTIEAVVRVVDTGTTLAVRGRGEGFNANLSYISFFYGTGSVSRGSLACLPPTPNNLTVPQMITAYWVPVGSTRRTLSVIQSGASYTPLSSIGTMSVRYDTNPTQPLTQTTLTPGRFFLNSCGALTSSLFDSK